MKEYLGLSWSQEKKRRRIWAKIGVCIASEHKERKLYKEIVKEKVRIDGMVVNTQTIAGPSRVVKPVGLVPDIQKFIFDLLDKYNQNDTLTWHDGGIPADQIWVKIGGDHGRGSMKMSVQIANVDRPNAKEHTHVVAMIEAKDTHDVLKEVIMNLNFELEKLKTMKWEQKSIKVFLFGDYAFLCNVYGLSGANGAFPCLWCLTTRSAIQNVAQGPIKDRTLSSIRSSCNRFHAAGNNLKNAKIFKNCIRPPLLNIEVEMVVPMYLHILLGIVLKHHNWLVAETHLIDIMIAEMYSKSDTYEDLRLEIFDRYVRDMRRREELKESVIDFEFLKEDATSNKERIAYEKQHTACARELSRLNEYFDKNVLKSGTGPVANTIEQTLKKHKIESKAWHGGSFIGNHCDKYMKREVYTNITDSICNTTARLTQDDKIIQAARKIKNTFDTLNSSYSRLHQQISHTRKIDPSEHDSIQQNISTYMTHYRQYFPGRVIPKMHILEHHCLPFIETYGFGLGLMGEQGGEHLHASMTRFEQRMSGIRNPNKRLKSTIEAHHAQNSPTLRCLFPDVKQRKENKEV